MMLLYERKYLSPGKKLARAACSWVLAAFRAEEYYCSLKRVHDIYWQDQQRASQDKHNTQ
jgi:hypothetical protein